MSTILATGQVKYIAWSKCTTSRAELLEIAEVQHLALGPGGTLMKAAEPEGPDCDVSTDLLVDCALQRRSLAAEISGLCEYAVMQLWHETLKEALLAEALPGYCRVSYAQLVHADRELWNMVAAKCRNGCKQVGVDGTIAFQNVFQRGYVRS